MKFIPRLLFVIFLSSQTLQAVSIDPVVAKMRPSATLASQQVVEARRAKGEPVYNWGLGASPFPIPEPIVDALRDHAHAKAYTPVEGIPQLREAIFERTITDTYIYDRDDVLVAPGLKQLLYDVQHAFGGRVIHVAPHWVSYREQADLLKKKPLVIFADADKDYKLTPQQLDEACQNDPGEEHLLIFNHPANPTGATYSPKELAALAEVCRKHQVIVFADEVYLGLYHNGTPYSLADFYPEMTIRASSMSKEFGAGGWRLGWATFPPRLKPLKQAMAVIGSSSYSCAPVPQQYAAVKALEYHPEIDAYVQYCNSLLQKLGKAVARRLRKMNLTYTQPKAAWYTFIDFEAYRDRLAERGIVTSTQLTERLIKETGIVFVPGEAFGLPADKLCVRAAYVDFSGEEALDACPNDFSWARHILNSLDVLRDWLPHE